MAKPCDFLMILVLMSYWSTCCLSCDLSQNDNFMNKTLFKLLVQKEQSSRLLCLEERKVFLCPLEKMDAQQLQKPQVIKVLYDVIQQSLMLFSSNESSAAWETTLREQFCDVLSLKLEDLQSCLMQQWGFGSLRGKGGVRPAKAQKPGTRSSHCNTNLLPKAVKMLLPEI